MNNFLSVTKALITEGRISYGCVIRKRFFLYDVKVL
jgi:hypothetical protein